MRREPLAGHSAAITLKWSANMVPASISVGRWLTVVLGLLSAYPAVADDRYPQPRRVDVAEVVHGIEIRDPYRWMENAQGEELEAWLERQDALIDELLEGPDYERSRQRILEMARYDLGYAARRRGDRLYYLQRGSDGADVRIVLREEQRDRALVDATQVPDDDATIGGRGFAPTLWPNRSGSLVAYGYTIDDGAWRWRIVDAASGRHLPDRLEDVSVAVGGPAWNATGDGFYYMRMRQRPSQGTGETIAEPDGLWFHALGTDQAEDVPIIEASPGDRMLYSPRVTDDGRRLVVTRREGTSPTNSVLVFDTRRRNAPPVALFDDLSARFIYLGNRGATLYFQTTLEAPNGRVVAVDVDRPDRIAEVVAESDQPMLAGSNVGGDVLGYFGGYFLLGYLEDGLADLRVFDHRGRFERRIDLPAGSSVWGTLDAVPGEAVVTVSLLNPFRPGHVVSLDLTNGEIETRFSSDVPVDPKRFVVRRVFYDSKDGTRVPMSVVHRKGLMRDGSAPALVYGYGMHKWVSLLFYQAHIVHWLEEGGVYAMPAIRGGGEYGDAWHAAGIKTNRQNAVDDFVAAGRWLIDNGYTSADRLAANGGSASGALAGIVPIRYAATFAASTIDYPIADLARARHFGNGALLVEEYGSLDDPAEARALIEQSPYHAIDGPQCFPATLIMVGEEDKTALPFHGYKLAAAMQHEQECDAPVLLHRMRQTGHNYGQAAEAFAANTAIQLVFLWESLGES
ncbi:MAG: prolyl oligopeptidase family serine peptidase [Woeseiaceae bacterium]|nr:prolyl oligopeptidase family serine peptidase [Woeseiaceae bacterium]